jgi:hypothetical protein
MTGDEIYTSDAYWVDRLGRAAIRLERAAEVGFPVNHHAQEVDRCTLSLLDPDRPRGREFSPKESAPLRQMRGAAHRLERMSLVEQRSNREMVAVTVSAVTFMYDRFRTVFGTEE